MGQLGDNQLLQRMRHHLGEYVAKHRQDFTGNVEVVNAGPFVGDIEGAGVLMQGSMKITIWVEYAYNNADVFRTARARSEFQEVLAAALNKHGVVWSSLIIAHRSKVARGLGEQKEA